MTGNTLKASAFLWVFLFCVAFGKGAVSENSSLWNTLDRSIISQDSEGNVLLLDIQGNDNGGFGSVWSDSAFSSQALLPGNIRQTGQENLIAMSVLGDENLFSIVQSGTRNTVSGTIVGNMNSAVIVQTGDGNFSGIKQMGSGNSLNISQSSW